jgi:hypothetical protein
MAVLNKVSQIHLINSDSRLNIVAITNGKRIVKLAEYASEGRLLRPQSKVELTGFERLK